MWKKPDIIKTIHQRKSCKWDGPCDDLKVRKRLEYANTEHIARPKRPYSKKSADWWEKDIFQPRNEKKKKIQEEVVEAHNNAYQVNNLNLEDLTDIELQDMLSTILKKKTRI